MVDINNNKAIPTTVMGVANSELANAILQGNGIKSTQTQGYIDSNSAIAKSRAHLEAGVADALNQLAGANQTQAYNQAVFTGMEADAELLQEQASLLRQQNELYERQKSSAVTTVGSIFAFSPDETMARTGDKLLDLNVKEQEALKAQYDRVGENRRINAELTNNRANLAGGVNPNAVANAKTISDALRDQRESFSNTTSYNDKTKQLADMYIAETKANATVEAATIKANATKASGSGGGAGGAVITDVERIKADSSAGELQTMNTVNGGSFAAAEDDQALNVLLAKGNESYEDGDIKAAEKYYKAFNEEVEKKRKKAVLGMPKEEESLFSQRLAKRGKLDSSDKAIASSAVIPLGTTAVPSTDYEQPEGKIAAQANETFINKFKSAVEGLKPEQAKAIGVNNNSRASVEEFLANLKNNQSAATEMKKFIPIEKLYTEAVTDARANTGYDTNLQKDFGSYVLGEAFVNPAVPQPVKQFYNVFRNPPKPSDPTKQESYNKLVTNIQNDVNTMGEMEAFTTRLKASPLISDQDKMAFLAFIKQPQFSANYVSTLNQRWGGLSNKTSTVLPFLEPETWGTRFSAAQSMW